MNLHELLTAYQAKRTSCARSRLRERLLPRLRQYFEAEGRPDDLAEGTAFVVCETISSYDGTGWQWVQAKAELLAGTLPVGKLTPGHPA